MKKLLVACEESQRVCMAFRKKGWEAYSCDIQEPSGGHPEWHILGDALEALKGGTVTTMDGVSHDVGMWDMLIAHPPCTFICKGSACRMYPQKGMIDQDRYQKAMNAKDFFLKLYNSGVKKIVIENPRPLRIIGLPKESQIIHPYYFGDVFSKETLLWEIGVPPLVPSEITPIHIPLLPSNTGRFSRGAGGSKGNARTAKDRSKTSIYVAMAMAEQWGDID